MRRKKRQQRKDNQKKIKLVNYLIAIFILLAPFLYFKLTTKYWDGEEKINIAVQEGEGDVTVYILDPALEEEVKMIIPAETEVSLSQNLGSIRIKNVQKLGNNEDMGFDLLPKTITKSFMFPVNLFSDTPPASFKFVTTKNTNIGLGDRVAIYMFDKKVKNLDRSTIDLAKSLFVTKAKLTDGELGYVLPNQISPRLTFYFSDNDFLQKETRVYIKDASGVYGLADTFGKIIEVMGGKVVTIEKVEKSESSCSFVTEDKKIAAKMEKLFDCTKQKDKVGDFELEVILGSQFAL